jgi:hypothetical protein
MPSRLRLQGIEEAAAAAERVALSVQTAPSSDAGSGFEANSYPAGFSERPHRTDLYS